jgi:hypothetical protein
MHFIAAIQCKCSRGRGLDDRCEDGGDSDCGGGGCGGGGRSGGGSAAEKLTIGGVTASGSIDACNSGNDNDNDKNDVGGAVTGSGTGLDLARRRVASDAFGECAARC